MLNRDHIAYFAINFLFDKTGPWSASLPMPIELYIPNTQLRERAEPYIPYLYTTYFSSKVYCNICWLATGWSRPHAQYNIKKDMKDQRKYLSIYQPTLRILQVRSLIQLWIQLPIGSKLVALINSVSCLNWTARHNIWWSQGIDVHEGALGSRDVNPPSFPCIFRNGLISPSDH